LTYAWGLALVGGLTGLCAVAGAYWQLLLFRGLAGIGSTMLTVAAAVLLLGSTPPHQRGRAIGLFNTAAMLGLIGGPLVGGLQTLLPLFIPEVLHGDTTMTGLALSTLALGTVAVLVISGRFHRPVRPETGRARRLGHQRGRRRGAQHGRIHAGTAAALLSYRGAFLLAAAVIVLATMIWPAAPETAAPR
jgi:MFS family permease